MGRYTKEELLKSAAPYFSQGEKVMYATSDGNYFYEHHKHHAVNHRSTSKAEIFVLTEEDYSKLDNQESELEKAQKALDKAKKYLEGRKTPDAIANAQQKVDEAQELVDKLS
jgi:hypothetical protein